MVDLQPVPDTVHLGVRSGLRRSSLSHAVVERLAAPPDVVIGGSLRAPPGTVGLHLSAHSTHDDDCAFLISHEFSHVHADDSAMHLILPDPIRTRAVEVGWAEPHPLAGRSTISPDTVMLHAPRSDTELQTVARLAEVSWQNAHD